VDEMQLHVPQDIVTAYEVQEIMGVNKMIVSAQSNKPIMGIVQDGLLGVLLMTRDTTTLTKQQFMDCVFSAGDKYCDLLPDLFLRMGKVDNYYTGKALFSLVLPRDFNYSTLDNSVVIKNGILIKGIIDKNTVGRGYYAIHHRLYKEYSPEVSADFLSELQFIVNRFILIKGFSVGLSDFIISDENKQTIKETIQKGYIEVKKIEASNDSESLKEFKINGVLNVRGQSVAINGMCKDNRLKVMVDSGSKGNKMNIVQIAGNLGQNNVEGKRIQAEIDCNSRTLFTFERGDTHPVTKGYIENCFMSGLTVSEMFFHTKAGREGVINTACKTRDAGYTARKMVKRMDDLIAHTDFTIRNCTGNIVQFAYGNDNLDPTLMVNNSFVDVQALVSQLNCEEPQQLTQAENCKIMKKVAKRSDLVTN